MLVQPRCVLNRLLEMIKRVKPVTDKNTFWSPLVHQLEPYVPGEQPVGNELIKLNTNESPYPPSPKALAAISACGSVMLMAKPPSDAMCLSISYAGPPHWSSRTPCRFCGW